MKIGSRIKHIDIRNPEKKIIISSIFREGELVIHHFGTSCIDDRPALVERDSFDPMVYPPGRIPIKYTDGSRTYAFEDHLSFL